MGMIIAAIVLPILFVVIATVAIVRVAVSVVRLVFTVALTLAAILAPSATATR
jgi:hypothetical protein